jgi:hypothetical protein
VSRKNKIGKWFCFVDCARIDWFIYLMNECIYELIIPLFLFARICIGCISFCKINSLRIELNGFEKIFFSIWKML